MWTGLGLSAVQPGPQPKCTFGIESVDQTNDAPGTGPGGSGSSGSHAQHCYAAVWPDGDINAKPAVTADISCAGGATSLVYRGFKYQFHLNHPVNEAGKFLSGSADVKRVPDGKDDVLYKTHEYQDFGPASVLYLHVSLDLLTDHLSH